MSALAQPAKKELHQAGTHVLRIPAYAGMTARFGFESRWIPAGAGMTRRFVSRQSQLTGEIV